MIQPLPLPSSPRHVWSQAAVIFFLPGDTWHPWQLLLVLTGGAGALLASGLQGPGVLLYALQPARQLSGPNTAKERMCGLLEESGMSCLGYPSVPCFQTLSGTSLSTLALHGQRHVAIFESLMRCMHSGSGTFPAIFTLSPCTCWQNESFPDLPRPLSSPIPPVYRKPGLPCMSLFRGSAPSPFPLSSKSEAVLFLPVLSDPHTSQVCILFKNRIFSQFSVLITHACHAFAPHSLPTPRPDSSRTHPCPCES